MRVRVFLNSVRVYNVCIVVRKLSVSMLVKLCVASTYSDMCGDVIKD